MLANSSLEYFDPIAQTITDIFNVIGHSQDESKRMSFEIQSYILQLTLADLITQAPQEAQSKLIAESKNRPSREKAIRLFQQNFKSEEVINSYQAATFTVMQEYFAEVSPNLSDDQKRRIAGIIQKQYSDLNRK